MNFSVDAVDSAERVERPRATLRGRAVAGRVVTVLAVLVVLVVLLAPGPDHASPAAAVRLPVEGLLGLALVLAVPGRGRRLVAGLVGGALGLWAALRIIDVGFYAVLYRSFDPVLDWRFLAAGVDVIRTSRGPGLATAAAVVAVIAAVLVVGLVVLSVLRLAPLAQRHRTRSAQVLAGLTAVWAVCAVTGVHLVSGVPVAGRDYLERLAEVNASLGDSVAYAQELANDPYRDTPGEELLTALRGKDVVFVLVESYGRTALEQPEIAPMVTDVLTAGTDRLAAAGFASRSAFLTSPTAGGGSWLAQATLQSGTWVDNQGRYVELARSDHLPLAGAFQRAGWHTVAVMPGTTMGWPEGGSYGFDEIQTFDDLDYAGPLYGFDTMPDQYVLSFFERTVHAPAPRDPVMALVPLISSHAPWSPVPALVDWSTIGDGSGFAPPAEQLQPAESVLQRDPARVRADYAHAIGYTLESVLSYVETYGDDELVLVLLGDHQPVPTVTGNTTNRDVPISIVTRDQAVLDRTAGWSWGPGLLPSAGAPVWRMSEFRSRFLAAFA